MELMFLPRPEDRPDGVDGPTAQVLRDNRPRSPRPFANLEIEPTTRCNLSCPSCPRTVYGDYWIHRDMSLERFERVAQCFDRFETIHFRGWGEPLLNPYFPEMVRLAHESGARLVLSTNGVSALAPELLSYFDAVTYRLDYGLPGIYEMRNPGARFNRVIFNISQALHWRDHQASGRPYVSILFAKNKHSLSRLPAFLNTGVRLHPDRIVCYLPPFHVRKVDDDSRLPGDSDPGLIEHIDSRLSNLAESAGIDLINQPVEDYRRLHFRCMFDYKRSLFVSFSGRASACRHAALPVVGGKFLRYIRGRVRTVQSYLFGNLAEHSLETVLSDPKYRAFHRRCPIKRLRPIPGGGSPDCLESRPDEAFYPLEPEEISAKSALCSL